MYRALLFLFATFFMATNLWALNLKTEDFAINLPSGWTCDPDESLVICTEVSSKRKKAAIVLINFKKAAPTETLADFRNRLNKPKSSQVTGGAPRLSRVVSFQDRVINSLTWIEALHFEGELPDYYTYYLATRKSGKFFLISLSAHKKSWDKYRPQFENIIASLRILTPEPSANMADTGPADYNAPVPDLPPPAEGQFAKLKNVTQGLSPAKLFLFAAVIIGSLLVLYAFKS